MTNVNPCSKHQLVPLNHFGTIYTKIKHNSIFLTSPDFQCRLKIIKILKYQKLDELYKTISISLAIFSSFGSTMTEKFEKYVCMTLNV